MTNRSPNGTTIFNILDDTTELWMTKYIIGEFFSSGGEILYKNPSDQTVMITGTHPKLNPLKPVKKIHWANILLRLTGNISLWKSGTNMNATVLRIYIMSFYWIVVNLNIIYPFWVFSDPVKMRPSWIPIFIPSQTFPNLVNIIDVGLPF